MDSVLEKLCQHRSVLMYTMVPTPSAPVAWYQVLACLHRMSATTNWRSTEAVALPPSSLEAFQSECAGTPRWLHHPLHVSTRWERYPMQHTQHGMYDSRIKLFCLSSRQTRPSVTQGHVQGRVHCASLHIARCITRGRAIAVPIGKRSRTYLDER